MSLKGQKCLGNLCIDGVFSEMRIEKKRGQVFTRVGRLVNLYSLSKRRPGIEHLMDVEKVLYKTRSKKHRSAVTLTSRINEYLHF